MKRSNKTRRADREEGSLQRNNVYTTDAVRDWAGRIHCGHGGIKMNEKYLLEVMASSCNPRGICELPVRYLADHVGVGIRQAQRIIQRLIRYELVAAEDFVPQGRPIDVVRKFLLRTTIDPDTWSPKDGDRTASYTTLLRAAFAERIKQALTAGKINDIEYLSLAQIHIVCVQSKRLDFVSPDAEVTNTAYRYKKVLFDVASTITKTEVLRLHMIPKKGYRG